MTHLLFFNLINSQGISRIKSGFSWRLPLGLLVTVRQDGRLSALGVCVQINLLSSANDVLSDKLGPHFPRAALFLFVPSCV